MLKKIATATALAAACLVGPAFAAQDAAPEKKLDLTLRAPSPDTGYAYHYEGVATVRPVAAIIATDALYGGIAGAAIGAGVALINGNDYGRDIGVGAGIGIITGGIIGAIDASGGFRDQARPLSEGTPALHNATFKYGSKF
jgi:hypothetical protein